MMPQAQTPFNMFNSSNNSMNSFHQTAFNKPKPQLFADNIQQQQQQQQLQLQQQQQQLEQFAKLNGSFNFPPGFLNSNSHNIPNNMANFNQQQQQQQQSQQPLHHLQQQPTQSGVFNQKFEFDMNPALRQLRDIADKSSLINSFTGLNNNPMFNYFHQ